MGSVCIASEAWIYKGQMHRYILYGQQSPAVVNREDRIIMHDSDAVIERPITYIAVRRNRSLKTFVFHVHHIQGGYAKSRHVRAGRSLRP